MNDEWGKGREGLGSRVGGRGRVALLRHRGAPDSRAGAPFVLAVRAPPCLSMVRHGCRSLGSTTLKGGGTRRVPSIVLLRQAQDDDRGGRPYPVQIWRSAPQWSASIRRRPRAKRNRGPQPSVESSSFLRSAEASRACNRRPGQAPARRAEASLRTHWRRASPVAPQAHGCPARTSGQPCHTPETSPAREIWKPG